MSDLEIVSRILSESKSGNAGAFELCPKSLLSTYSMFNPKIQHEVVVKATMERLEGSVSQSTARNLCVVQER